MKVISVGKLLVLVVSVFLLIELVGCSDFSKGDKKAYKAVLKHQQERYPVSNKEFEIVYPKLKDMAPFVEGRSISRNDTWDVFGTYTFNPEKVPSLKDRELQHHGGINFEAYVELIDGEYVITGYTESLQIRGDLDD